MPPVTARLKTRRSTMEIAPFALMMVGFSAAIGALVGKWRLLLILLVLWIVLQLYLALAGDLDSNEDTPETLVILSFLYFLLPVELGAAIGTATRKLVRRARRRRHATDT